MALSRAWIPAGVSRCYGVYSSLLLCWLPLLGACSRRCGSCLPPEVSFGLRSFWCVRFFLALGCVLPVALSRTWIPAGVSRCYGVYSSLLLCWLPLLGACSQRCGSCRPPEVSFGLRSFWSVRFFLALGCVLPVALSRTWIPAGASLCYGVYSSLLFCWLPPLGACSRRCGSCRPAEVSFGLRSFWCVRFFLALGCVLPVALSRTWIPAGASLCCGVCSSLLLCWLPLLGACSRRCGSCRPAEVSFGLRSFWCVRFFLALGCVLPVALSRTWIPAGVSLCYGVCSSLLLCWLPLLGACFRRCGSCRPAEVSFGLRSFWCVRFFLALGCVLLFWPCLFAWCLLLVFLPQSGGVDLILCLVGQTLARSALLAASVPYVLSVVVCFLHPWFLAWLCSLVALSRVCVPPVFMVWSWVHYFLPLGCLPLVGACSRRCGSCRPAEVSFGLRSF